MHLLYCVRASERACTHRAHSIQQVLPNILRTFFFVALNDSVECELRFVAHFSHFCHWCEVSQTARIYACLCRFVCNFKTKYTTSFRPLAFQWISMRHMRRRSMSEFLLNFEMIRSWWRWLQFIFDHIGSVTVCVICRMKQNRKTNTNACQKQHFSIGNNKQQRQNMLVSNPICSCRF